MELDNNSVDGYWAKSDNNDAEFFIINDAIISKLCILGEEYEPCFEGAQITSMQFSLADEFKTSYYSMIEQMQELLNKGGQSMVNKYSVTVGDALWTALYSYLDSNYPNLETNTSIYSISGVYEDEEQKFAVLYNAAEDKYYRLVFSLGANDEEEINIDSDLTEMTDYVLDEIQFNEEDVQQFVEQFNANKNADNEEEVDETESNDSVEEMNEVEKTEEISDNNEDEDVQEN